VLAIIGASILAGKFGTDLLVSGPVAGRIAAVSEAINSELRARPRSDWESVLEDSSSGYGVKFLLFQDDGHQLAGEPTVLQEELKRSLRGPADRFGQRRGSEKDRHRVRDSHPPDLKSWEEHEYREHHGQPEVRRYSDAEETRTATTPGPGTNAPRRFPDFASAQAGTNAPFRPFFPQRPRFVIRTESPARYWMGMPMFFGEQYGNVPRFCTLLIESKNLYGGGLFFDIRPIALAGGWALLFSVVFWFPLVRGITRSLAQMTHATEHIAQGRFDGRVQIRRRDELGQLGTAVNKMAERLQGLVTGQKRFLGDTAHELCAPLARIQLVVGILEQRADQSSEPYIKDLREEVQHMSELVAELLSFSKASLASTPLKLQPVLIRNVVQQAVQRESNEQSDIRTDMDWDLQALADPELLQRSLANLLRNAVRYAGNRGPIVVSGTREAGTVLIKVSDAGPGVPEHFLQRLFDPFFRVDDARTRESGGVGLGLTIVKTCIEACGGTVTCSNRQPSGLEVMLRLKPPMALSS
jgi:two-component system sensor histidine kinase CpxA